MHQQGAAHVALLSTAGLQPQTGALRLDVPDATARVALLGSNRTWRRARSGLMARLAAIVAETLLRGTIFRNMTN